MGLKAFKSAHNTIIDIDPNDIDPNDIDPNDIDPNDIDPNTDKNSISYAQNTDNNIAVVDLNSEEVLAVVPASVALVPHSKNKIIMVPGMSYNDTGAMKIYILKYNKGKACIYRWIRIKAGKSYIGWTGDLNEMMANYFSIKYLERRIKTTTNI